MSRHAKLALKYWNAIDKGYTVKWIAKYGGSIIHGVKGVHPPFREDFEYSLEITKEVIVPSFKAPAPMSEPPPDKTSIFIPTFVKSDGYIKFQWTDNPFFHSLLKRGLVYKTQNEAEIVSKRIKEAFAQGVTK